MNVWILNHYGSPPGRGRFERPVYMGMAFVRAKHECTVIYSAFHHLLSHPSTSENAEVEVIREVNYVGLPCRAYNGNGIDRVQNMLDFKRTFLEWRMASEIELPDVVIASSPHPFVIDAGCWLRKRHGIRLIFEVRDLWPESLNELAGISPWHPFSMWVSAKVRTACKRADAVVSLLPETSRNLESKGMEVNKFHWIPNGIDASLYEQKLSRSLPDTHLRAVGEARKRGRFLIGYAGAMGPPNALDQLIDFAGHCSSTNIPIHFLLVGDGVLRSELEAAVDEMNCDSIQFLPSLEKDQVPSFLREMDANIIFWNDSPIYQYGVSPNKVSEYMLSGKPVVWVGNTANDPVLEAGCGVSIKPNDVIALEKALKHLVETSDTDRIDMGVRGKDYVLHKLNWERLGNTYVRLIETV